jgi:hypothetical protein
MPVLSLRYPCLAKEKGMKRLFVATLLLVLVLVVHNKAFASILDCKFKNVAAEGIDKIQLIDEDLIINGELLIPLEKSRVRCGNFGRQVRFDGTALGYQVVLKSCSTDAALEGVLIDAVHFLAVDVSCHSKGLTN